MENNPNKLSDRKREHIHRALASYIPAAGLDPRFNYEPLLAAHPNSETSLETEFLGKKLGAPLWVSSMTGGTTEAGPINRRLAEACAEFSLGMGLGSCRPLLESSDYLDDFNLRPILGSELPLLANIGLAQVDELLTSGEVDRLNEVLELLKADALMLHVNPLQEWFQPEGDLIKRPALEIIQDLLEQCEYKVLVKEVGQGMGPKSLKALLNLPIAGLEFGAFGGTNFSQLELSRGSQDFQAAGLQGLCHIGHTAEEMVDMINLLLQENSALKQKAFIISGGLRDFLDGHYLMKKLGCPSIYGQASQVLKAAQISAERLRTFVFYQLEGLKLARNFLQLR